MRNGTFHRIHARLQLFHSWLLSSSLFWLMYNVHATLLWRHIHCYGRKRTHIQSARECYRFHSPLHFLIWFSQHRRKKRNKRSRTRFNAIRFVSPKFCHTHTHTNHCITVVVVVDVVFHYIIFTFKSSSRKLTQKFNFLLFFSSSPAFAWAQEQCVCVGVGVGGW